jgi:hypothetical protein
MLILVFLGLGFLAYRRKRPLSVIAGSSGQRRPPCEPLGTMLLRIGCPIRCNHAGGMSDFDAVFSQATESFLEFSFPYFLGGCSAKPECDSSETRLAVLQAVSDDHRNPLVNFAAKNSSMAKSTDASSEAEKSKERPLYLLSEKIITTSTSEDKRTLKCNGGISVTVGDTKASKEINFTVQQSPDGKISVSVAPFEF